MWWGCLFLVEVEMGVEWEIGPIGGTGLEDAMLEQVDSPNSLGQSSA